MTDLLTLAARCEAATEEEQRALIIEAFAAINDDKAISPAACGRFGSLMNGGGYIDAALTLVPEGAKVTLQTFGGPGPMALVDPNERFCSAATLALAICAAALRAREHQG